jgi:hypothetical protein
VGELFGNLILEETASSLGKIKRLRKIWRLWNSLFEKRPIFFSKTAEAE